MALTKLWWFGVLMAGPFGLAILVCTHLCTKPRLEHWMTGALGNKKPQRISGAFKSSGELNVDQIDRYQSR